MFKKRHDALSFDGASVSRIRNSRRATSSSILLVRNNNVDEGVIAFGLWLNAGERRDSVTVPIVMKEHDQDRAVLLRDNILQKEVVVKITEGIPFCGQCRLNDCVHVGFAICAEQMKRRSRSE